MENENQQRDGANSNQGYNEGIRGRRASDSVGVDNKQSDQDGKEEHTATDTEERGSQGTSEEKLSLEEREKIREAKRNDPATLYNKAMEEFDPEETEPQLAEHTRYRNADYDRDGML